MELSAEVFEQTVAAIKGSGGKGQALKRGHPRAGVRCRVKLIVIEKGAVCPPVEAWTRDISRSGIGLSCARRLEPGTHFAISLPRGDREKPLVLLCTVKNCFESSPVVFEIGAIFHDQGEKAAATPPAAPTAPSAPVPKAA